MGRRTCGVLFGHDWKWALRATVLEMYRKKTGKIVVIGHNRLQSEKHLEFIRYHLNEWIPNYNASLLTFKTTRLYYEHLKIITARDFTNLKIRLDVVIFEDVCGVRSAYLMSDDWGAYRSNKE